MAAVQPNDGNKSPDTPMSVWLVVDVPGRAAVIAEESEKAMREYAKQWVAETGQNISLGERHQVESGQTETGKLKASAGVR